MRRVLCAMLLVGIVYIMYIPVPAETFLDRLKLQFFEGCLRILYFYPMTALSSFGNAWQLWWARVSLHSLVRFIGFKYLLLTYDLVKSSEVKFNNVSVIAYEPKNRLSDGAIVLIHGGGFVLFDAPSYDSVGRCLALNSGMVTFSIDYRTAPEHVFPTPIDDCESAVSYLLNTAYRTYNVDPKRVVVIGDSAGGNLAAVSTLRLMNNPQQEIKPKLQILVYPLMQFVDFLTPSYQAARLLYGGSALADPESIARWSLMYFGLSDIDVMHLLNNQHVDIDALQRNAPFIVDDMRHDMLPFSNVTCFKKRLIVETSEPADICSRLEPFLFNGEVSPLLRHDLAESPKTMVITCEYDPLRDEGFWYAKRLEKAGVEVTWRHYENAIHGIMNLHGDIGLGHKVIQDIVRYLEKNL